MSIILLLTWKKNVVSLWTSEIREAPKDINNNAFVCLFISLNVSFTYLAVWALSAKLHVAGDAQVGPAFFLVSILNSARKAGEHKAGEKEMQKNKKGQKSRWTLECCCYYCSGYVYEPCSRQKRKDPPIWVFIDKPFFSIDTRHRGTRNQGTNNSSCKALKRPPPSHHCDFPHFTQPPSQWMGKNSLLLWSQ